MALSPSTLPINGLQHPQFYKPKELKGLTDSNSLAQAMLVCPELTSTVAMIMGPEYPLQFLTQGTGRYALSPQKFVGSNEIEWTLFGVQGRMVPLVSVSSTTTGANFTPVKLVFGEDYFEKTEVIRTPSGQHVRVQAEPVQDGTDFQYLVVINTNDPTAVLTAADLAPGALYAKTNVSTLEEYSNEAISGREETGLRFRNQMTIMRHQMSMTGSAQTDRLCVDLPNMKGGPAGRFWIYKKEFEFMKQWARAVEYWRWYGNYNRDANDRVNVSGTNGRPVLTGDGILNQIAYSNRRNYSTLSEGTLANFLVDLSMAQNGYSIQGKEYVIVTGYGGMMEFNKAMQAQLKANTVLMTTNTGLFVTGSGQNLTYVSPMFTRYEGLFGLNVTLVINPIFNDKTLFGGQLHPKTGWPLESYKLVVLDYSMYGGESNIALMSKGGNGIDRSMLQWYVAGAQTPETGPQGSDSGAKSIMRSNALDGWTVHYLTETLIRVLNPMSCGEMFCDIAAV